jgi:hypothetical protein
MKFSHDNKTIDFKPFTVSMTFETQEDANLWTDLLMFNVSIPQMAFGKDSERVSEAIKHMSSLRAEIFAAQ